MVLIIIVFNFQMTTYVLYLTMFLIELSIFCCNFDFKGLTDKNYCRSIRILLSFFYCLNYLKTNLFPNRRYVGNFLSQLLYGFRKSRKTQHTLFKIPNQISAKRSLTPQVLLKPFQWSYQKHITAFPIISW